MELCGICVVEVGGWVLSCHCSTSHHNWNHGWKKDAGGDQVRRGLHIPLQSSLHRGGTKSSNKQNTLHYGPHICSPSPPNTYCTCPPPPRHSVIPGKPALVQNGKRNYSVCLRLLVSSSSGEAVLAYGQEEEQI